MAMFSTRRNRRRGVTLAELVISAGSTMVLIAGLSSAVFVANQAAAPDTAANLATTAGLALDDIASELRTAKAFSSKSVRSVTFSADDRSTDAGSFDETISYSWDGTAGGSINRTYNGVSTTLITDVYNFALTYTTKPAVTEKRVLFVQGNVSGTEATYDTARVQLMQSWGYSVVRKTTVAATTQLELETAAMCADVIYVSTTVNASDLGTKLKATTKGVILEEAGCADYFGVTSVGQFLTVNETELKIADISHPITSTFDSGNLIVATSSVPFVSVDPDTVAPGFKMHVKPRTGGNYALGIINPGGTLADNTQAAGARVLVPWGGTGINPNSLNSNGKSMWRKTLDWATGTEVLTSIQLELQIADRTMSGVLPSTTLQTRAEMIGKPRP